LIEYQGGPMWETHSMVRTFDIIIKVKPIGNPSKGENTT